MKIKPKKKFQGGQAENIVMRVIDYKLDEKGAAVALKGVTFPDKREVEVSFTDTGKYADNPNRRTMEGYRKGFNLGGTQYKLEPGGLVSFSRAYKKPDGGYQTPWMDVLAYNSEKAQQHISSGLSVVRMYTPRETKPLLKETYEKLKSEGVPQDQLAREVEKQLPDGTQRYRGVVEMYHPSQAMRGTNADELRSAVETYFNDVKFQKHEISDGKMKAQADPGAIIRFLDQENRVADYSYIPHYELYQNGEEFSVQEQADYVLDTIRQTQNANQDLVAVDVLPFSEFTISHMTLQVGKSGQKIENFRRAFEGGHPRTEDGEMETVAHPALVKFSMNGYFINAVAGDFKGEGVDPVLLAKDGQTLTPTPQLYAEPEEPEGPQAGQESPSTSEAAPAHPVDENIVPAPASEAGQDERTSEDEDGPAPGR